ncbi:hypothetical protein IG611_11730 [Pectobacterium sp. A535-S3-A17]|uniref:hypothetical protein n=1 Tax=Pectobacterium quasiaquaticum TaxID=2774015 RepID=UPI0018763F21|nr:hypothetical protein [Pectobacterium quasiaquaticum]MBE5215825.1 hypothetical protein [Pectobacterium quasiaquaticum]MBE5226020.1 hypothetical protein [Pectobacterium quasiaquaticum]
MSEDLKGRFQRLKGRLRISGGKSQSEINSSESCGEFSPILNESSQNDVVHQSSEKLELVFSSKYKLMLQQVIVNGLIGIAEDKLKDDVFIESVFNKAYEILPTPVRLILNRKRCLDYLIANKEPLLEKIQDYRAGKLSADELADSLEESLPLLTVDPIPNFPGK